MDAEDVIRDELERLGHRVLAVIVATDCDQPRYSHVSILCLGEPSKAGTFERSDLAEPGLLRAWIDTRYRAT